MALAGWQAKAPITINTALVTGNLTGFPMFLNHQHMPPELFDTVRADGGDIRFASDAMGTNVLTHQIFHFDKNEGTLALYVKCDLVASGSNIIYVFWNNPAATLPLSAVWTDYYAAVHFQETPTDTQFKAARDWAGTYNAVSCRGTPQNVAGPAPGHRAWRMPSGNFAELEEEFNTLPEFYFEFFINYNGTAPGAGTQTLFAPIDFFSGVGSTSIGINAGSLIVDSSTIGGSAFPNYNAWTHVGFWANGTQGRYYRNGELIQTTDFSGRIRRAKWLSGAGGGLAVQFPAEGYSIAGVKFTRDGVPPNIAEVLRTRSRNVLNSATWATPGAVETVSVSASLTIDGVIPNTEVRVFRQSDLVELAGQEDVNDGRFVYNFTEGGDVVVQIFNIEYEPIRLYLTLGSESIFIPVQQRFDRVYRNP